MNYRMWSTFYSFKGLFNNMFPCLCKYLNRYILRYQFIFNQGTHKVVLCLRGRRKSYFYLFKTYIYKHFKKLQLLPKLHRLYESLITISKIHGAPTWRFIYVFFFNPVISRPIRHKIIPLIFIIIFHFFSIISLKFILNC